MAWRFCLLGCLLALASGCGGSGPFEYVPVSGKVVYEDGTPVPLAGARIQFYAQDVAASGDVHPRPALATLDANGEFAEVTSHKYGDGLIPGRHKVVFQADAVQGGKAIFPPECGDLDKTPLIVDTAELPLVIQVKRP